MARSQKSIDTVRDHLVETRRVIDALSRDERELANVVDAAKMIGAALKRKGTLFVAGNGGSAGDAQHFAAELVGWYHKGSPARSAIALTTDSSFLTAWSNDATFDEVFSRQLEALGRKGDVLFVMSTSGNSKNILVALKKAKKMGIHTIALLGTGGAARTLADLSLSVPSTRTPHIQEGHIAVIHAICECLELPKR